jgi:CO dehydrogenase maturation factor
MTKIIAMAGKGGTGKTTLSALLIKYFVEKNMTPVLAVDADSNANLNELVGLEVGATIGQIRKELKGEIPVHMTRDQYMEMKVHQALIETKGFDLMVMGQPDGPGCYCAANQHLAMTMDHLGANYKYILVDNEAGMEHLSRMNLTVVDHLFITSDPSARGILTAQRISELTDPLGIDVKNKCLVVNRAPDPMTEQLSARVDLAVSESKLPLGGFISASNELVDLELTGGSCLELPENLKVIQQAFKIFDEVFK